MRFRNVRRSLSVGDHRNEPGCLFDGRREVSPSLKETVQGDYSQAGEPLPRLILQKALAGVRGQ